jgi:hypothetical protein
MNVKLLSTIAAAVLIVALGLAATRLFTSITSAPPVAKGKEITSPRAGGGPTEADLQKMRDYNAAHPGASSSRR